MGEGKFLLSAHRTHGLTAPAEAVEVRIHFATVEVQAPRVDHETGAEPTRPVVAGPSLAVQTRFATAARSGQENMGVVGGI